MANQDVYVNGTKEKPLKKTRCPLPTEPPHYIDWQGALLKKQKMEAEKAKKAREKREK
ncbi:MAG: hypothetical protein JRG69_13820 [Deltaproteobacteria bacterium]|nr:hypothetical protein [Deltaproteobacteria bacterium]